MSRPTGRDEAVIRRAAELSLDEFKEWLGEDGYTDEQLISDLCETIRWEDDGYERAKALDRRGYGADTALVELLDGIDVWRAEREAVAAWVKQFDVKPPCPIGTVVEIDGTTGEIIRHDEAQGLSTVFVESKGHVREGVGTHGLLIAWEKLKPLANSKQGISGQLDPEASISGDAS